MQRSLAANFIFTKAYYYRRSDLGFAAFVR